MSFFCVFLFRQFYWPDFETFLLLPKSDVTFQDFPLLPLHFKSYFLTPLIESDVIYGQPLTIYSGLKIWRVSVEFKKICGHEKFDHAWQKRCSKRNQYSEPFWENCVLVCNSCFILVRTLNWNRLSFEKLLYSNK